MYGVFKRAAVALKFAAGGAALFCLCGRQFRRGITLVLYRFGNFKIGVHVRGGEGV